jgi:hypothetical protein
VTCTFTSAGFFRVSSGIGMAEQVLVIISKQPGGQQL